MAGITLVLAVCGGIVAAGRRFLPQGAAGGLQVVGRVSLSPKHSVYLLRVGRRVLLVGAGPQGAPSLISELDDLAEIEPNPRPGRRAMRHRCEGRPRSRASPGPWPWLCSPPSAVLVVAKRRDRRPTSLPHRGVTAKQGFECARCGVTVAHPRRRRMPVRSPSGINRPADLETAGCGAHADAVARSPTDAMRTVQTVALFGLISLAPMGLLMVTAFVRINIVLILLRQALGSPQVPGNQVLTALALLLTALVMRPMGEEVYHEAIVPYAAEADLGRRGVGGGQAADQGVHGRPDREDQASRLPRRRSTNMRFRPARAGSIPPRSASRTFRCAWWRRRTCSAS